MAAKHPEYVYTCDICGEEGFSEVEMRSHTMVAHIEGAISCPFCDLGDISSEEMVFHVNSMHLDFISPTEDNVQFTISSSDSMDDVSLSSNGLPDTNFYSASESSPQRAGSLQLLVLDPSHSKSQMEQFNSTSSVSNAIRLIKRPMSALKARQYQLVYVDGVLETEEEYQSMKILHSQRIPPSS